MNIVKGIAIWLLVGFIGTVLCTYAYPNKAISLSFGTFMVTSGPMAWSPVMVKGFSYIADLGSEVCMANCKDGK